MRQASNLAFMSACLLIYEDLDVSFNNWSEISTFDLETTPLDACTIGLIDKKIDESISGLAILLNHSSNTALALIGIFLNLDAAALLGNSKAGFDESWIKDCEEIRVAIANNRNLKSEKEKLLESLSIPNANKLLSIIQQATSRKTPVFLLGDLAIALGFLVSRTNSQAKNYLHVASSIQRPGIIKAAESMQLAVTNLPSEVSPAKGLAIALLSHV